MKDKVKEPVETNYKIGSDLVNYVETKKLSPIVKWAGGKEQELKFILPNLPKEKFTNYYEPFVGGGAVYTAIQADSYFINDKSDELVSLYRVLRNSDRELFFKTLYKIIDNWEVLTKVTNDNSIFFIETYKKFSSDKISEEKLKDLLFEFILTHSEEFNSLFSSLFNVNIEHFIKEIKVNLIRKTKRMKKLEKQKHKLPDKDVLDNIETALKSAFYMHFRHIYNNREKYDLGNAFKSAVFLFIRNYTYSGMFRYNSKGEFNVPYGGIAYNRKNFKKKIDYLKSKELKSLLDNTIIENEDFEQFLNMHPPTENDFIFLDPPYDSEFSTYAQNEFNRKDQERLANYLINSCKAKWMVIIKNTDFIFDLYNNKGLNISSFDKTYLVSFMNRNNKDVEHLLITNYKFDE